MYIEAYVIITTGQVKTVWHHQYPTCWDYRVNQVCPDNIECLGLFPNTPKGLTPNPDVCNSEETYPSSMLCNQNTIAAVSYSEFAGIMAGMLIFGYVSDLIGRKRAGILTSVLMIIGLTGMTFYTNSNDNTLFAVWSVFFALFGLGVGGEYPLTASGAAERHLGSVEEALKDNVSARQMRIQVDMAKTVRRGETIALVFTMQGVGAVAGSLILMALIYFGQQSVNNCDLPARNSSGNDAEALNGVWRAFYFIGLLQVLVLFIYRGVVAEESESFAKVQERQKRRKANGGKTYLFKILMFYAPRLLGTAGCW